MTSFTLYNKNNKKPLRHPKIGLWYTNSAEEADQALGDLFSYLDYVGMSHLKENFSVIEVEKIPT